LFSKIGEANVSRKKLSENQLSTPPTSLQSKITFKVDDYEQKASVGKPSNKEG